jgi:hypothetical protein
MIGVPSGPDSPFHGWKLGELVAVSDQLRLRSGTHGIVVDVIDKAMCFKDLDHEAPQAACQCGFAANAHVEPLVLYSHPPFSQLFEVELSGRVIQSKAGPRAETQRILSVILNPLCYQCRRPAAVITSNPSLIKGTDLGSIAPHPLVSTCIDCAGERYWSLAELREDFSVDFLWARPEQVLVLLGRGRH